jgi:hypothetical protein
VNFFAAAVTAAFDLNDQPSAIRMQPVEAAAEFQSGPSRLRIVRQALNQRAPLDDEIWLVQCDSCGATVGEEFEAAYLVNDAGFTCTPQQASHSMRDDERPRSRLKSVDALKHTNRNTSPRQQRRCKETCGRPANHGGMLAAGTGGEMRFFVFAACAKSHIRLLQLASLRKLNGSKQAFRIAAGGLRPLLTRPECLSELA